MLDTEPNAREAEDVETLRLVRRLQSGEVEAFDELYHRYINRVYGYLMAALGDHHEAEDGAQEVLLKVLENVRDYEIRSVPFRIWMFRVARNWLINHLERRGRTAVEEPAEIEQRIERQTPVPAVGQISDDELLGLIRSMPAAQGQALVLRFLLGFQPAEVAKIIGRSPNAVYMLQARALEFMRTRLVARGYGSNSSRRLQMRRLLPQLVVSRARRLALCVGFG